MFKALLIVGHGSGSKEAVNELEMIVDSVKRNSDYHIVSGAFIKPSGTFIEETVERIVNQNINHITVIPLFLFSGRHTLNDIPDIITKLQKKYSEVKFVSGKHIGYDPEIAGLIIKRAKEADNNE
jgi:sirohydrochlorin ferrochelatase